MLFVPSTNFVGTVSTKADSILTISLRLKTSSIFLIFWVISIIGEVAFSMKIEKDKAEEYLAKELFC